MFSSAKDFCESSTPSSCHNVMSSELISPSSLSECFGHNATAFALPSSPALPWKYCHPSLSENTTIGANNKDATTYNSNSSFVVEDRGKNKEAREPKPCNFCIHL